MIKNLTNKKVISKNAKFCSSMFSRFKGLMLSKKQETALIFEFKKEQFISLHMLFVFYPIDVLFLDKTKKVVDMKECFRPFSFYNSRKRAMYAVELFNGAVNKSKTKIGDRINF